MACPYVKVTSTNVVHAKTTNVRAYIMGTLGSQKKFVAEISRAQSEQYLDLVAVLHADMQSCLGQPLNQLKAWAQKRKLELLDS